MVNREINYKTTQKDFELYKKECQKWIEFFGLKQWRIEYRHEDCEELARIWPNYVAMIVTISLNTDFGDEKPEKDFLRVIAFHEICELLLTGLVRLIKHNKKTKRQIWEEVHKVIRTLENSVWHNFKK